MQKKITKNKIQKPGRPKKVLRKASGKKGIHRKTIKEIIAPKREFGLHNLKVPQGSHKRKKILGRGSSSGHGKTSTRGSKGQTSRAGRDFYLGFEGGQTPLIRRIPKRGFVNRFKKIYQIINLKQLNQLKEPDINLGLLEEKGLIKDKNKLVKILGDGEIKNLISIQAHAFSKKAAQKIKNAGGKAEIINA
jgi:large subunit ribosomal protein L15